MPYRFISPNDPPELQLRMLFQPADDGTFLKACEADSFRALVGALLDDSRYETAGVEDRLMQRLRLADDVVLLAALDERQVRVADHDGPLTVNVASDEPFVRSLHRLGFVSLAPSLNIGGFRT